MLDEIKKKYNLVVLMKFGSHLYGTDSETSDVDYKGVYIPDSNDYFLQNVKSTISLSTGSNDSKNTNEDIDIELFSINQFFKLACEGQTVAIDMLHAPDNMIIEKTYIWDKILSEKNKFYTKNLKAFVGYAKRQANKYGIKGSRLNEVRNFLEILYSFDTTVKLKDIWVHLPVIEHSKKITDTHDGIKLYEIVGKKFQETCDVGYVRPILEKYYKQYGQRAKDASENKNIDWKAVSHAVRASLQVKEILLHQNVTFPLQEAKLVKDIKYGKLDYTTIVAPMLEYLIMELEELSQKSSLPEKVNQEYMDKLLLNILTI